MSHPVVNDVKGKVKLCGLAPQINASDVVSAVRVLEKLHEKGAGLAEIVWSSECAAETLECAAKEFKDMIFGAADVCSVEEAKQAMNAGAAYIATPGMNPEIIQYGQKARVAVYPGCATLTEAVQAVELDVDMVRVDPANGADSKRLVNRIEEVCPQLGVMVVDTLTVQEMIDYLSIGCVAACTGVRIDAADLAVDPACWMEESIAEMIGFGLAHVGINSGSEEAALGQAEAFCTLLNWPVRRGNSSIFAGKIVEFVKNPWTGTHGHIAIGVNNIHRAWWYMERRGIVFDWENAKYKDNKLAALYLPYEIGGFSVHLQQR